MNLLSELNYHYGFNAFRPGQKEAILAALSGKDSLVMLPTGTGKSLCYQLFGYITKQTVVIVSPLISLMQDQVNKLKAKGEKSVCALNSHLNRRERNYLLKNLKQYQFIYLSPEILENKLIFEQLKKIDIGLFVIDEAHCVSEWGLDFRPEYLSLANYRFALDNPPIMALTATANDKMIQEIQTLLKLDYHNLEKIIYPLNRSEIKMQVIQCQEDKDEKLLQLIDSLQGPGIVYFSSKKEVERVANKLKTTFNNLNLAFYHSEVDSIDKNRIQEQFIKGDLELICATNAFGMGVDKQDIRYIIHYHLPSSPEMYFQEIGRACRDHKRGIAITLYKNGDEDIHHFLREQSLPDKKTIQHLVNQLKQKTIQTPDDAFELIKYLDKKGLSLDRIQEIVEERSRIKMQQLDWMTGFVNTDQCKRKYMLNYFNEALIGSENLPCCSSHQKKIEDIYRREKKLSEIKETTKNDNQLNWRNIFTSLYNL